MRDGEVSFDTLLRPGPGSPFTLRQVAGREPARFGDEVGVGTAAVIRSARLILVFAALLLCVGAVLGQPVVALAGVGVALSLFASMRFEALVLAALVLRATLDATKGGIGGLEPATVLGALFLSMIAVRELLNRSVAAPARHQRVSLVLPLTVLLAVAVVSSLLSPIPVAALTECLRLAGFLAMILALEHILTDWQAARRVALALFASATVPIIFGIGQLISSGGRQIGGFSRVVGTFLHPNPFSLYLVVLLVFGAALYPYVGRRAQFALGAGGLVAGALVLFTYTRTSWIALVLGLLVVGLLQSRALLAVVLAGSVAVAVMVPSVAMRFSDLESSTQYSGTTNNSLAWRVEYWQESLQLVEASPWLGIGLTGIGRSTDEAKNAHNDVVRMFVETGIAGLMCYLWVVWALIATARRALRRTAGVHGWERGCAVGFAGVLSVIGLASLTSNVITQVVLLWYVAAMTMLAVAGGRHVLDLRAAAAAAAVPHRRTPRRHPAPVTDRR